jgi:hypothetical protein
MQIALFSISESETQLEDISPDSTTPVPPVLIIPMNLRPQKKAVLSPL